MEMYGLMASKTQTCLGDVKGCELSDEKAIPRLLDYARRFLISSQKSKNAGLRVIAKSIGR